MDQVYDNDKLTGLFEPGNNDHVMLNHVVSYYHQTLKQSSGALEYLRKRGISGDAVNHFQIGYSNRSLGVWLPEKNRKAGAAIRGQLQRIGILRPNGREHLRGSIVIPVINNGVVKTLYGRKTTNKVRPGTPLHLFIPKIPVGIFNLKAAEISEELILCQSIIDALTFWSAGYRNVTCNYGLDDLTQELLDAITSHSVKRVLIAYVNSVGDAAAEEVAQQLMPSGIDCYRIEFPEGKDANATAMEMPPASDVLGVAIRKAVWLGKGDLTSPSAVDNTSQISDDLDKAEEVSDSPAVTEVESQPEISGPKTVNETVESQVDSTPTVQDFKEGKEELVHNNKPLPATVLPPSLLDVEAEVRDDDIIIHLDNRRYRIRGLEKNLSVDQLKVNILVNTSNALFVDTFDLYAAKPRASFIRQAALELDVSEELLKLDLGKVLLKLEQLQDDFIRQALKVTLKPSPLSDKECKEALSLLESPDLLQRIVDDYGRCGVVGERTNKLVGYLAVLSRKLDKPLAVMIQSTSAAGKTALMDAVLSFVPEEDRIQYSAMTGQSLFYMGGLNVKHKILAISEEEGASNASYALKLLQSDGQLTIASTGKDPKSSKLTTQEYKVEGPVMIFSTTTAIDIDEELLNRCLVLTVDEDRAQTQAIHEVQRFEETLEGLLASQERFDIFRVHRNAQRLIKPLKVVNPYANQLTFLSDKTRTRRDHKKYLTLIRSIALLHQYQREIKTTYYQGEPLQYIEATLDDIAMANQLAHEVLGRSLDEIPHQTRRLLMLIDTMVTENCEELGIERGEYRFTRRDIREYTGWGDTQLKVHLQRLQAMEYLLIHRRGHGQCYVYELLYAREGQDGRPFLMGLVDVEQLKHANHAAPSVGDNHQSVACRPPVGGLTIPGRDRENVKTACQNNRLSESDATGTESSVSGHAMPASYSQSRSATSRGDNRV